MARAPLVQVSLVWGGEVIRVEPWSAGQGSTASCLRLPEAAASAARGLAEGEGELLPLRKAAAGYRSVEPEAPSVWVRIERVEGASRWPRGSRTPGAALGLLSTLALHLLAYALTFVPPSLAPADDDVRAVSRQILLHPVIFADATSTDCEDQEKPDWTATRSTAPEELRSLRELRGDEQARPLARPEPRPRAEMGLGIAVPVQEIWPVTTRRGPEREEGLSDVERKQPDPHDRMLDAVWHIVEPGETLTSIAERHGFESYLDVYNARMNPELVRRRPDPNRIFPGDRVRLPAGPVARER